MLILSEAREPALPSWQVSLCLCLTALVLSSCGSGGLDQVDPRYSEIRRSIKDNLYLSAHLVRAVDARTVEAVRKEVTEADIPILVRMLGDEENAVGIGAQHVLEEFGDKALSALQEASHSPDYKVSGKANEAIRTIQSKNQSEP